MELLIIVAVVGVVVWALTRATGRRREEDPNAHIWGTPMWLLGGLFFLSHGADQSPGGQDMSGTLGPNDPGNLGSSDFGSHDFGGGNFGGGGGDFGGGTP